jgi:hypothetical protein
MWEDSVEIENANDSNSYVKQFQIQLKKIPYWN